jgi:hypothetical protein
VSGPFETEREAREAAAAASPGLGALHLPEGNASMLHDGLNAAGVQPGAYDRRIVEWLAGYEPSTCAVIAGLITRAAEPIQGDRR